MDLSQNAQTHGVCFVRRVSEVTCGHKDAHRAVSSDRHNHFVQSSGAGTFPAGPKADSLMAAIRASRFIKGGQGFAGVVNEVGGY